MIKRMILYNAILQALMLCSIAWGSQKQQLPRSNANHYIIDVQLTYHDPYLQKMSEEVSHALPTFLPVLRNVILGYLVLDKNAKKMHKASQDALLNRRIAQCMSSVALLGSLAEMTYGFTDVFTNQHTSETTGQRSGWYGVGLGVSIMGGIITHLCNNMFNDDISLRRLSGIYYRVSGKLAPSRLMIAAAGRLLLLDLFALSFAMGFSPLIADITGSCIAPASLLAAGGGIGTIAAARTLLKSLSNPRKAIQLPKKVV